MRPGKGDRTTYLNDGNLNTSSRDSGKQYAQSLNANMELKREQGNVWFHVRPMTS